MDIFYNKFVRSTVQLKRLIRNNQVSVKRNLHELKCAVAEKLSEETEKIKNFRKEHGNTQISDVTVNKLYGGMRGILGLLCETSLLDENEGIRFRNYTILQCQEILPKAKGGSEPLPEGLFWLLLTGKIPTDEQVSRLSEDWASRGKIPKYVEKMLKKFPKNLHPMSQLSCAVTALNAGSHFVEAYKKGVHKSTFWEYLYEDSMDLIAKLPIVCSLIYKNTYRSGETTGLFDECKDWTANYTSLLGYDDFEFTELMRLYFTIHSDHEGGNVSAHATTLVGSALSDPYISYASGINGLAGPLHGLANQEVLVWIDKLKTQFGDTPSDEEIKQFILKTLKSGQVIPGYGHAVLVRTDPRFTCQQHFAERYFPDDKTFKITMKLYELVPPILQELGKVRNPWPNVDAISGTLLQHYGLTESSYYTVLFAMSRALGALASLIWIRALGIPIERPKSITTEKLIEMVKCK